MAPALLERLAKGWGANSTLPREFMESWRVLFGSTTDSIVVEDNTFQFSTELEDIKLRGMDDILCFGIGSGPATPLDHKYQVWRQSKSLGRMIFLFAFSDEAAVTFADTPKNRCLRLGPLDVRAIFTASNPLAQVKRLLWSQISLRKLSPFDIGHTPQSHVFYGRKKHLNELIENDCTSYALVGPLGIGKTTLLRQYKRALVKNKDARVTRAVYVNFAYCQETAEDRIARFLAMQIDPTARNDNLTVSGVPQFIRRLANSWGGPPELILDEVNDFCFGPTFQALGNLMREGHCRLLLSGRGPLYRALTQESEPGPSNSVTRGAGSSIERRQAPMRLGALEQDDARRLLSAPFGDLGLQIDDDVLHDILEFTGRIPHLLHYCAVQLIDEVASSGARIITKQHFEAIKVSFDAGQFFTDPLRNFDTADAKYLALICLSRLVTGESLSVSEFQDLAHSAGIERSIDQIKVLGDELVINNVLMWTDRRYQLATGALSYYARDWGYLDRLLAETKSFLGLSRDTG